MTIFLPPFAELNSNRILKTNPDLSRQFVNRWWRAGGQTRARTSIQELSLDKSAWIWELVSWYSWLINSKWRKFLRKLKSRRQETEWGDRCVDITDAGKAWQCVISPGTNVNPRLWLKFRIFKVSSSCSADRAARSRCQHLCGQVMSGVWVEIAWQVYVL